MVKNREQIYLRPTQKNDSCPPEFFKVFIPHHSSHQLLIPPAFKKHLEAKVPQKCTIENPANRTWIVSLEQVGNNLFFKEGWQEFVKDHALKYGDFLTFQYHGNSSFNVNLYSKNGCSMEISATANCSKPPLEQTPEEEKEVLWDRRKTTGDPNVKMERPENECLGMQVVEKRKRGRPRKLEMGSRPLAFEHNSSAAIVAANRYISKYPSFKIVLTPAYIHRFAMHVPYTFLKTYMKFKGKNRDIYLQVSDRLWPVIITIYRNSSCELTTGWQAFLKENDLHAGDVCIFELIKLSCLTLNVSIFRC
ncbi:hypothetical protein Ancab_026053 [Ancistrocladus abbreviatus]